MKLVFLTLFNLSKLIITMSVMMSLSITFLLPYVGDLASVFIGSALAITTLMLGDRGVGIYLRVSRETGKQIRIW